MTYTIKYGRGTVNHIAGLDCATKDSVDGMTYAISACGSLSKSGHKMAKGKSFEDITEALAAARITGGRTACKSCEKAALRIIEAQAEQAAAAAKYIAKAEARAAQDEAEAVKAAADEVLATLALAEAPAATLAERTDAELDADEKRLSDLLAGVRAEKARRTPPAPAVRPVVVKLDLTAPDRAIALMTGGHGFANDRQMWLDRIGSVGWEGCDDYDDRIIRTSGNTARGCVNKWLMVLGINARDAVVEVHREY